MSPTILFPAMGKSLGRVGSLILVWQCNSEVENSEFIPVKLRLKNWPACVEGLVNARAHTHTYSHIFLASKIQFFSEICLRINLPFYRLKVILILLIQLFFNKILLSRYLSDCSECLTHHFSSLSNPSKNPSELMFFSFCFGCEILKHPQVYIIWILSRKNL